MEQVDLKETYSEMIPLHKALLEIVTDFRVICEAVGVDFFLVYGTLLGAARHNNIIPWDDDIDLGMMRSDYEKLIRYFLENSVEGYFLYCAETSNEHTQIFSKLVRVDGKYESLSKYYTHREGLSIDIFPLDEARSQSDFFQRIRGMTILYLRRIVNWRAKLHDPQFKEPLIKRIARLVIVFPFCIISNHRLLAIINNLCKTNNGKGFPNIINYSTTDSLTKENDPRECWYPADRLKLGETEYPVPGEYKRILAHIYGENWNEIPPAHRREQHTHFFEHT